MTEQDTVDRPAVDADDAALARSPRSPIARRSLPQPRRELTPGGVITRRSAAPFEVHLDVFSGPFDLLLGLISKHKLDITEVALAKVTDEFVAHIKAAQATDSDWDLGQASEFLLIAATLLDLKASRLLPSAGPQDDEDLALIEARDLLFARLLQYRAYKEIAGTFRERMATAGRITPRQAGLEPEFASLLPELVIAVTPEQFAMIAARAMTPKVAPDRRPRAPARARRSASGSRPRSSSSGCATAARSPSAASSPMPTARSSSSPGSSRCSSSSRRRPSPSSRPRRSASSTSAGPAPRTGDDRRSTTSSTRTTRTTTTTADGRTTASGAPPRPATAGDRRAGWRAAPRTGADDECQRRRGRASRRARGAR